MKNKKITICGANVHPGEVANLALQLPEQYSCAPLYMPIKVVHGEKAGPCLVIFSVLKGRELNGLEIANRIVKAMHPSKLSGTVIAIPVMNVYGLTHYPAILPTGNDDLAKCFPGKENGTYGERMAYLVTEEIFKKADYCIELETGDINHNILPQVYCDFENKRSKELAKMFRSPVVTNLGEKNNLRQTMEDLNIPLLVYQAGEALRFDENVISLGFDGIKNVMRATDILVKEPVQEVVPIFSREEGWITAHKGGILHPNVSLGQTIEKGETIGNISDPFGADIVEPVTSPRKGIVVGVNTSPLIYEGLAIFKVVSFLDYDKAETAIEEWDKIQPSSYISSPGNEPTR